MGYNTSDNSAERKGKQYEGMQGMVDKELVTRDAGVCEGGEGVS